MFLGDKIENDFNCFYRVYNTDKNEYTSTQPLSNDNTFKQNKMLPNINKSNYFSTFRNTIKYKKNEKSNSKYK